MRLRAADAAAEHFACGDHLALSPATIDPSIRRLVQHQRCGVTSPTRSLRDGECWAQVAFADADIPTATAKLSSCKPAA
jgi:hypothetical protein